MAPKRQKAGTYSLKDPLDIFDDVSNDLSVEPSFKLPELPHPFVLSRPRLHPFKLTQLERQWEWIGEQANRANRFKRVGALATAVGAYEVALMALGLKPDQHHRPPAHPVASDEDWPTQSELKDAYVARNKAVHNLTIPSPRDCLKHINVLFRGWRALRGQYVTKKTAGLLATEFLGLKYVSSVMLFGSLASGASNARDIDLLLLDDGELSSRWSEYGTLEVGSLLETTQLSTKRNRAAHRCHWLDVIAINGKLFERNLNYRRTALRRHKDPLFFLNLADGLLVYDKTSGTWVSDIPPVFGELAALRSQLQAAGVVRVQPHFRF